MNYYRIRKAFTDTALVAAGVYTSDSFHTVNFDRITGIVISDQAGTLVIQQSIDGTNWDYEDSVSVTAATGTKFDVKIVGEYARVEYTNGATDQASFRLAAYATPQG